MNTQSTDMEVDNSKYKDAPAWFANYINDFRNYVGEYRHDKEKLNNDIKSLSDHLEVVEASHASLRLKNTKLRDELEQARHLCALKLLS